MDTIENKKRNKKDELLKIDDNIKQYLHKINQLKKKKKEIMIIEKNIISNSIINSININKEFYNDLISTLDKHNMIDLKDTINQFYTNETKE